MLDQASARRRRTPPMWSVEVRAHRVERWIIPASVSKLPAPSGATARLYALRVAHGQRGLPPWKPLLRRSWPYTNAERVGGTSPRREVVNFSQQVSIFDRIAA